MPAASRAFRRLEQDRRTRLGRDHRIRAVFEHVGDVADADRERAAGAAFADDRAQDRRAQLRHLEQVARDRFALATFFRADAGIRAGRVDEGEDRQLEALGELHEAQRLAVTLRTRHAEVALDLAFGVAAFLVADDDDAAAIDARDAADDRRVVRVGAIAREFVEFLADDADVVERVRPRRMARQLRHLPRREVAEDLGGLHAQLALQRGDLVVDVERVAATGAAQFLELGFQIGDRLFEI
jgi:hypothetical protein